MVANEEVRVELATKVIHTVSVSVPYYSIWGGQQKEKSNLY
jgi:hypothetical protein